MEHVDVVIVGAGLSGIGAAHHLQDRLPGLSYAILEAREALEANVAPTLALESMMLSLR